MSDKLGEVAVIFVRYLTPILLSALTYIGDDIRDKLSTFDDLAKQFVRVDTNQKSNMRRLDSVETQVVDLNRKIDGAKKHDP